MNLAEPTGQKCFRNIEIINPRTVVSLALQVPACASFRPKLRHALREDVMKYLRFRVCIQVVLLTTTVTLSQVFAEESPQQKVNNDTQNNGGNSYVGQGILQVLPKSAGAVKAAFPSDPGRTGVKISSPGRTYGALTVILAAAGGAAALSFLLTRGGDKHASPAPVTTSPPAPVTLAPVTTSPLAPVTTSVTPGTPVISAPPGH
jgi:hypothetical protein